MFRSLATLAQARFQHPLFRDELLSALKILQEDHIPRRQFVGSWAGAMGQPQFLPSSFLTYAVDFDGDGRPDIWRSVPDVLASIANYLRKSGWQAGVPWGFEVLLPRGFDFPTTGRGTFARLGEARARARRRQPVSRKRRGDPVLPERRRRSGFSRDRQFHRAQAIQQFRCLRACGRRAFGPVARTSPDQRSVAGQ